MNKGFGLSALALIFTIVLGFSVFFLFVKEKDSHEVGSKIEEEAAPENDLAVKNPYAPPGMDEVPEGAEGDLIKQGYVYHTETSTALDGYVGNKLSCASCHAGGATDGALDLVGVTKTYPQYNPRAGKEVDMSDRINGCFKRSMNGKPLPKEGAEMKAMLAYYAYISQNVPDGTTDRPWAKLAKTEGDLAVVDIDSGKVLYNRACITCHGDGGADVGAGMALWGDDSYNIGAGMSRIRTSGGYIKTFMPKVVVDGIEPGSLTDEEAMNIAAYINAQNRPDFPDKINDWPNGDAPDDAAYETLAGKKNK